MHNCVQDWNRPMYMHVYSYEIQESFRHNFKAKSQVSE